MKRNIFLVSILFAAHAAISQTNMPDRVVYAAAGKVSIPSTGNTTINNKVMTYTIGEPIIYSGQIGTNVLHNGFEQPDVLVPIGPTVVMLDKPNPTFKVYPNPFTTQSIIEGPEDQKETINLQLLDANAKIVGEYSMNSSRLVVDFENQLATGIYYLNFYTLSGQFIQQNKLIKQ